MKLLLAQNMVYVPSHGGANKSNRRLVERLAARGHEVHAVVPALGLQGAGDHESFRAELSRRGVLGLSERDGAQVFELAGVEVHAVAEPAGYGRYLAAHVERLTPDVTLVTSEDPDQTVLEAALDSRGAVVYLAHTPMMLPFGDRCFRPSRRGRELLASADGVVTVSRYMAGYLRRWGGIEARVLPFPVYGPGPFPDRQPSADGAITMINASELKGLSIFLELARRFPDESFAAVAAWGTGRAARAALGAMPNVELLEGTDDIEAIYRRARALVVPSLWAEAFGYVAVEAMLEGVPVLASDSCGLPEAKLGVDYVLPVRQIERFEERLDERGNPVPVLPAQDVTPWERALRELLHDRGRYEELATASRQAAREFVAGVSEEPFERYFEERAEARRGAPRPERNGRGRPPASDDVREALREMSPQARSLLAMKALRARRRGEAGGVSRHRAIPRLPRGPGHHRFAVSAAQERLWLLAGLEPASPAYNESLATRLTGDLERLRLARALRGIVRRHEVLRTTFESQDGRPVQVVAPAADLDLSLADLAGLDERHREPEMVRLARIESRRIFDLGRGPLLRVRLWVLGPREHVLQVTAHHIVSDGWSLGVFIRELTELYAALGEDRPPALPELPIQYADFAEWQRRWLEGPEPAAQIETWKRRLGDATEVLELPSDRIRPGRQGFASGTCGMRVEPGLTAAVRELATSSGATLYIILLTAFSAVLARHSGRLRVRIGSPVSGRTRSELEPLIGFFLNVVVLQTDLAGDPPFQELLRRNREVALEAFANQEVPFERLLHELQPERDLGRTPLFQVFFNMLNLEAAGRGGGLELPGVTLEPVSLAEGGSKFDLTLYAAEEGDGLALRLTYRTDLFEGRQMEALLAHLRKVLEGVVEAPDLTLSQLPLEGGLVALEADRVEPAAAGSIVDVLEERIQRDPWRAAVVGDDREWIYGELWERSGRVVAALSRHVETGAPLALLFEHGASMVEGMLGSLRAGSPYVPLDPFAPEDRLRFILEDSGARAVLASPRLVDQARSLADGRVPVLDAGALPEGGGPAGGRACGPEDVAYVLYTSGSTGRPKGVAQSHRNVLYHASTYAASLGIGPQDRLSLLSSYAFDASVMDIYGALVTGAAVVPIDLKVRTFDELADLLEERAVTVYHSTPTVWRFLVAALEPGRVLAGVRAVVLGGEEALRRDLQAFQRHLPGGAVLVNGLGPTESTMALQYFVDHSARLTRGTLPVGRPVPGTDVALVNDAGPQAALYGVGEIVITSAHVALGYHRRPEATAAAFEEHPAGDGRRRYRTGDLGRLLPGGLIEFVGRSDDQVKVRGYRIEPAEVEAAVAEIPGVRLCAVVGRRGASGDHRLVAYVVGEKGEVPAPVDVRRVLRDRLPDYMVPSAVVVLDELPRTTTGKIDRRRLPDAEEERLASRGHHIPETALEKELAAIWGRVLEVEQVGLDDHFFDLGGHSLLASQVVSRVRENLGVELPLVAVFERPVLRHLAAAIEELGPRRQGPAAPRLVRVSRETRRVRLVGGVPAGERSAGVLGTTRRMTAENPAPDPPLDLSLFFFSADGSEGGSERYHLLLDSVRFADRAGFRAVWTPERHFNAFGGLYPNPSVISAALATITERIELRAGSVVLPLQDPVRVAEEWAVVDNLSGGRVAIAFASGWHVNDFALSPGSYTERREVMYRRIDTVRRLWRGETVELPNGAGRAVSLGSYPRPVQAELPIWITSQSAPSFVRAGELGFNVLTNLNYKSVDQLGERIRAYREARLRRGHDPRTGRVTLMIHTFVTRNTGEAWSRLRQAYDGYLLTNFALQAKLVEGFGSDVVLREADREFIMEKAFERLTESHGLVGEPEACRKRLLGFRGLGVDEVACLVDFGIDREAVLSSLDLVHGLQEPAAAPASTHREVAP